MCFDCGNNLPPFASRYFKFARGMSALLPCVMAMTAILGADARAYHDQPHGNLVKSHLQTLEGMLQQRSSFDTVNIKVGVLTPEQRRANDFWVEFDPALNMVKEPNRIILPFGVVPHVHSDDDAHDAHFPFYVQHVGCSSFLLPQTSHTLSTTEIAEYDQRALTRCHHSLAGPPSEWRYWSLGNLTRDAYESALPMLANACRHCSSLSSVTGVRRFPVVRFKHVVDVLGKIDFLDIDAQGLDVALLLSLRHAVLNIKKVQLECQVVTETRDFLYHNRFNGRVVVENDCDVATSFLKSHGFSCGREINNCACSEYNLVCVRS